MELKHYKQVLLQYINEESIPYEILLGTFEWKKFRDTIVNRDNNTCKVCNRKQTVKLHPDDKGYFREPTKEELEEYSKPTFIDWGDGIVTKMFPAPIIGIPVKNPVILHVHHLYYIKNRLPWQYEDKALISVCHACHDEIHMSQSIPVYNDVDLKEKINTVTCGKCNGTGFINQFHYYHNGICFSCQGKKFFFI